MAFPRTIELDPTVTAESGYVPTYNAATKMYEPKAPTGGSGADLTATDNGNGTSPLSWTSSGITTADNDNGTSTLSW